MGGWVVGGWSDKTKLILISTLVEVVVEVEVELGNTGYIIKMCKCKIFIKVFEMVDLSEYLSEICNTSNFL